MFNQRQVLLSVLAAACLGGSASAQVLRGLGTTAGAGVGAGAVAAGNASTMTRDSARLGGYASGGLRGDAALGAATRGQAEGVLGTAADARTSGTSRARGGLAAGTEIAGD